MNEHEHVASSEYTECDICRLAARLRDQFGRCLALYLSYFGSDDFEARTQEARAALMDTMKTLTQLDRSTLQALEEFPLVIARMAHQASQDQPSASPDDGPAS